MTRDELLQALDELPPNRSESWLDVQTRAINHALALICARLRA